MEFKQDSTLPSDQELDRALGEFGLGVAGPDGEPMDASYLLDKLMGLDVDSAQGGVGAPGQVPYISPMPGNEFLANLPSLGHSSSPATSSEQLSHPILNLSPGDFGQRVAGGGMAMATSHLQAAMGRTGSGPLVAPPFGSTVHSVGLAGPSNPALTSTNLVSCGATSSTGCGGATASGPSASNLKAAPLGSPIVSSRSPAATASAFSQYEEDERQKREMHNFIERRRRYNINDRIKELGNLLPGTEPDTRQNKGNILKTAVSYIKRLQKIEARHRDLSRKHRQYAKTLSVFKSRLEEYDAACQSHGIVVPSASQEAALLTRVDLGRVSLDQCVTLVDCLESAGSEASDIASVSSVGISEDDGDWSEDDDVRSTSSTHSTGSAAARRSAALASKQA